MSDEYDEDFEIKQRTIRKNNSLYGGLYWRKKGHFQAEYDMIYKKYVPLTGKSVNPHTELLNAISKFYYDIYNNGATHYSNNQMTSYICNTYVPENAPDSIHAFFDNIKYVVKNMDIIGFSYSDNDFEICGRHMDNLIDDVIQYIMEEMNL